MKTGDESVLNERFNRGCCDKCKKTKLTFKVGTRWVYVAGYENELNRNEPIRWCIDCVISDGGQDR